MLNNLIVNWAVAHQQYLIGAVSGAALAHLPLLIHALVVSLAPWIRKYPAVCDSIVDVLGKEVHAVADAPAPVVPPAQPPTV